MPIGIDYWLNARRLLLAVSLDHEHEIILEEVVPEYRPGQPKDVDSQHRHT